MNARSMSAVEWGGAISFERAELLQLLLEQRSRDRLEIRPIPRDHSQGSVRVPTSWPQQRLWFIDQLEGGTAGYTVPIAVRLRGSLHPQVLQHALNTLMQRHEVLRTVFVTADGEPVQEILAAATFPLHLTDVSTSDPAEREARVRMHKIEEMHERFDLRQGPLIRGRLLTVQHDEHVLLITIHHIVADGWSKGVLIRELVQLYEAYLEGRANPLEPLRLQYADYVLWQRRRLQESVWDGQLQYWREHLRGASPELQLPTDRPRLATQSYAGENVWLTLDAQLTAGLKQLARRKDVTLFMVLYAGWALLLSRLSAQEEVVIGTPIANRQRSEIDGLIGLFVNTLVLRVTAAPELSVTEFLHQVKEVTLAAYDHQDVPFEKVVEAVQPQRTLSRNPLFQVMFVMHNEPGVDLSLPGLAASIEDVVQEPAFVDLFLPLEERGDEIVGSVNFAADLFDRTTVERWLNCFTTLLRGMVADADARIGSLPLLSERERTAVVRGFNSTREEFGSERLIHELFEEQVKRQGAAQAVRHEGQWLSYEQLNARANQLARYLVDLGVRADEPVGICVERSVEMVIGVLGILKAGAAYMPLDPNYPRERLQYMVEDASPRVVVTQQKLTSVLPRTQAQVVELDAAWERIASHPSQNLSTAKLSPQQLVYVIYTSGSTGQPKGTAMAHRSMVNLIEWHRQVFADNTSCRVLQFAALSFDVAFQEIFSTLCSGGTLVLLDEWIRRDGRALMQLLERESVQRLFVPPLMLQSLAEAFKDTGVVARSLRDVITAGEQLRISAQIVGLFEQLGGCRLHNHYGPTESHVVTALTLSGDPRGWPELPGIGRPIANTQIYVLDDQRQPVPIGVRGEIYIGGANVARGYLHRAQLTQQRFLSDPFSTEPTARLYRTGDVGRWLADGTLEYLGRNDDQVKIRGYRIELGEIEARLGQHAGVREAAVVVREDIAQERRLVAYITEREGQGVTVEGLRAHLQALLPEHMLPSAIVTLPKLPLTPSGKLDRRALPAPQLDAYVSERYEAPRGEIEAAVAQIWQQLLRVERVGRNDNFFHLGGHSLLATRAIAHIANVLNVELPLRALFEQPRLAALSHRIVQEIAVEMSMEAQ